MSPSARTLLARIRPAMAIRVAAVILAWLATTAWLIRFEACPGRFTGRIGGYRDLIRGGVVIRSSWMRLLMHGVPIGYSRTDIDVNEKNPAGHYRIDNQMEMELNVLGQRQPVFTRLQMALDVLSRLQTFRFSMRSKAGDAEIQGRRVRGDRFKVRIQTAGDARFVELAIPDDVVLYSPLLEQSLGALQPGQSRTFRTLDPASMSIADVRVRADRRESLARGGGTVEATVLATDYQGMTFWTWVDADGAILRQETPLGWTLEACTPDEAMAYLSRSGKPAPEILASAAAPADRAIPDPRQVRRLEVLIKGVDADPASLRTDRQEVLHAGTNGIRMVIRADGWPAASDPSDPAIFSNELAATPFIQSDDPEIVARSRAITAGSANPITAAKAINDWVYRQVRKTPTASLPSARAVLDALEGDCNEHTYLAVALARAAGVPAKVKAGLVYMNGAFYYHAWPAVRAGGRWVEMDPTFGQEIADATHIALAEGELAGQVALLRFIGRAAIGVLDFGKEPVP